VPPQDQGPSRYGRLMPTVLDVIGKRGARGLPVERLYRQMFNPQLYPMATSALHSRRAFAPI